MSNVRTILRSQRGLSSRIAREIGITHGAVSQWKKIPAEYVVTIERLSGIPRHVLRPDVFPDDELPGETT